MIGQKRKEVTKPDTKETCSYMRMIQNAHDTACTQNRTTEGKRKVIAGLMFSCREHEVAFYVDTHYGPSSLIPDSAHLVLRKGTMVDVLAMAAAQGEATARLIRQLFFGQVHISFRHETYALWSMFPEEMPDNGELANVSFEMLEKFFSSWECKPFKYIFE